MFGNVFNTVMNIKDKTKDNVKARIDLKKYCRRKELELQTQSDGKGLKPKANMFCLVTNKRLCINGFLS